jgi:NAD-dependent dihydropyrimidine dehydrogenase PreA subunit
MASVVVDPLRCEGKKTCAQVCPAADCAIRKTDVELPLLVRLKVWAHGGKQAFVVNEAACTACMKCVEVCPEDAIRVTP